MKALRVISGLHAGAWLPLGPGRYRIDSGEQAAQDPDSLLRLYDWTAAPLLLVVDAQDTISTTHAAQALVPGASEVGEVWAELQPRRYGEVVLCTGDTERPWPSDEQLLAMLRAPAPDARPSALAWMRSWSARAVVVGAGLLVAVGALYGAGTGSPPTLAPPQPALGAQWLSRSLANQNLHELEVRQDHREVVLSGLVRNAQQGQAVRMAVADVQRSTGVAVIESWEVADEIASTIESALRAPGLQAHYLGAGRFEVVGRVADPAQLQHAAPQLQKDLGANVRGIDFSLERIQTAHPFSTAMVADALQYSERPDGAKVFTVNKP